MAEAQVRNFNINFGPQHPAAHGVLRLVLELDGEVVTRVDPHIGLLHRGTEKLIEQKTYLQAVPYFDRLDYVAPMNQEHAFAMAVERMLGIEVPKRGQLVRVLYSEIGRILSHLLNVTTQALDVGALTPPLWGFEPREELMVFYERACAAPYARCLCSARAGFIRICRAICSTTLWDFCDPFLQTLDDHRRPFDRQPHLQAAQRRYRYCRDLDDAWARGFSGVMVRGSGAAWDLRKSQPYECYSELDFDVPVGKNGDNYDRYLIRMEEMRQSVRLMKQCLEKADRGNGTGVVLGRQDRAAETR